jgi:elongation factor Ts
VAEISAGLVKELRERTGAGMMECKKVLVEANGDLDRAATILRERGVVKASKRAGRATSEGRIVASVAADGRTGALVELNCETDFVAKTDDFGALARDLVETVRERDPKDVDALLALASGGESFLDRVTGAIAKIGENIQVRRFARLEASASGRVGSYLHAGGKIGVLVQVEAGDPAKPEVQAAAHEVCMHVAACAPASLTVGDLPASVIEEERRVFAKQAEAEGKPANIIEKMVEGRLKKFYKEVVLLEQPLVMDPNKTVEMRAKEAGAKVVAFRRFQLGEEIQG